MISTIEQIMSLNGYDEMNDYHTKTAINEDSFFQLGLSAYESHNNELVTPYHLLNMKSANDQYFAASNNAKILL